MILHTLDVRNNSTPSPNMDRASRDSKKDGRSVDMQ